MAKSWAEWFVHRADERRRSLAQPCGFRDPLEKRNEALLRALDEQNKRNCRSPETARAALLGGSIYTADGKLRPEFGGAAQGTEARSGETACGLDPKGDGPVGNADAPLAPCNPHTHQDTQ